MSGRRLRRLGRGAGVALASPPAGWLLARMLAWKLVFVVLKRGVPATTLVRLAEPRRRRASVGREELARIEDLVTRLGRTDDCLERSLVAYRFLARAGANPKLVLGFDRGVPRRGHAWVEVDERPVVESAAALAPFVPVAEFPR